MVESRDVVRLPFESSTPGIARTKLAAFLTRNRTDLAAIDNALIVLSEMIANAVAHGTPDDDGAMEISWAIENGHLLLSVRDFGRGSGADLVPRPFDEDSLGGRGLSIISRVADNWSVDLSEGTCVRAELTLA
ncbi:ATP-binding protein [Aeromicrobium sp. Marseille-Q0843]|uniref:ATP-binding protein n=1 Tax=Aeromicrobium phoceense TaxID=2754045 RepID=A0A838X7D7_9ACTN|nr:ATP-binding protein [Aeromicrobium phoceense]MBA4607409.1 ATP-binding protein [Aeromicrobium phoceense]